MISFEQRFIKIPILLLVSLVTLWLAPLSAAEQPFACAPTLEDEMGPFYKPGAPYRHSVGTGYLLFGTVKSAVDCNPVPAAMIELWMTWKMQSHPLIQWILCQVIALEMIIIK